MQKLLTSLLIMVISSLVFAEEGVDSVTFKTVEPAPAGFTSWTFFWSMPEIDPDATLEYVVLQPNGDEYYRLTIPASVVPGQTIRSDFSMELNECDPELLYGNEILFMFIVDKGSILFPDEASYYFEFTQAVDAVR